MLNTIVKTAELPGGHHREHTIDASADGAGCGLVHVNGVPLVWFSETNVIPLGTLSVSAAFGASSGPLLNTGIV